MAKKMFSKEPYVFTTLTAFSIAFFMTYILGNILTQIGMWTHLNLLTQWGALMPGLLGPAIGISIAYKSGTSHLGLICAMMAGCVGLGSISGTDLQIAAPFMAYICVLVTVWVNNFLEGKTPFDLFLLPLASVFIAGIIHALFTPYLSIFLTYIVQFINNMTNMNPLLMGIVIAVVAGLLFTSPITIVAITSILQLTPLACGAALAGVMSFMLGLGLMSLQDNDIGDSLAVIFGTSMLQFTNMIKHPIILIPPIVSSIVCGCVSAALFQITTSIHSVAIGGTLFMGVIETVEQMGISYWILPVVAYIILPIVINFAVYQLFRKAHYLRNGDLKILK